MNRNEKLIFISSVVKYFGSYSQISLNFRTDNCIMIWLRVGAIYLPLPHNPSHDAKMWHMDDLMQDALQEESLREWVKKIAQFRRHSF